MAQIKLAEYTFDNSVGDVMPSLTPNTITMTKEDRVSGTTTRRIVYIDNATMPTRITFYQKTSLLTVDYLNIDNNITSFTDMFYQDSNLTYVNGTNWVTNNVKTMNNMFNGCTNLVEVNGLANWNVGQVTTFSAMFVQCNKLKEANITNWKAPLCTSMSTMFRYCYALTNLDLSGFEVSTTSGVDMSRCFQNCDNLKITGLNTMKIKPTNLNFAFANITSTTIKNNFDFSTWDTSSCTNFGNMFEYSYSIETINVSNWDMSSTTSLGGMFNTCSNLKHIRGLDTWDVSGCGNYSDLFAGCTSLTDLSGVYNWDVSSATNLISMFRNCSSLKELDLRNWVTSGATYSIEGIFYGCENLEVLRVDNFDTSKLTHSTSMGSIFYNCKKLKTLNLNSFTNPGTLGNINSMFSGCSSLEYISMQNFVWGNCNSMDGTFTNCTSLKMLDLTTLDSSTFYNKVYGISGIIENITCPVYYNSNTCSSTDFTDIPNKTNLIDVQGRLMAVYDFNNSETGTNIPTLTGSTITKTIDTQGSESYITHRVIGVDVMPTAISFKSIRGLLNVDYLAVTSSCTGLASLFENCFRMTYVDTFGWDTSNVTSFGYCFLNCQSLTEIRNIQDLKVTSKVTVAYDFFHGCSKLISLDLTHWDVSSIQYGNSMFQGCTSLSELDLTSFKTTAMEGDNHNMFNGWTSDQIVYIHDTNWTIDVSSYNATFVRRLSTLLARYTFDNSVSDCLPKFNNTILPSSPNYKISDMVNGTVTTRLISVDDEALLPTRIHFSDDGYSAGRSIITCDYLNTSNCTSLELLFYACGSYLTSVNMTGWDTSKVTSLTYVFRSTNQLTEIIGIEDIDTSSLVNAHGIFNVTPKLATLDLSKWDVSKVQTLSRAFSGCGATTINISTWNTCSATTMESMFEGCALTELDITHFITSKVTNMSNMFSGCANLTEIKGIENWNISKCTSVNSLFAACSSLTSLDLSSWDTSQCTDMNNMFNGCSSLANLNVSSWNTSKVTTINKMFWQCTSLVDCSFIESWDFSSMDNMLDAFAYSGIKSFNFRNKTLNKLQYCATMLAYSTSLESVDFGGTTMTYNGGAIGNPAGIFDGCTNLKTANFDNMNFIPKNCNIMFRNCSSLTELDLSSWDTSQCTDMNSTFEGCGVTTLNLKGWNTSKVINMIKTFSNMTNITTLDLSHFDTSNVTNMQYVVTNCPKLTYIDVSFFTRKTSSTVMDYLFLDNPSLESIDISNLDMTNMSAFMFRNSSKLKTIGMLYSSAESINKLVANGFPKTDQRDGIIIYYYDADPSQLTPVEGVTFKKYQTPTTIQLPPHIQLHSLPDGTRDEVDIKTGILTRNVGYIVYDETLTWKSYDTDFYYTSVNIGSNTFVFYSNDLKQKTSTQLWGGEEGYMVGAVIGIRKHGIKTKEEFLEYIAKNPIPVVYGISEPTTEQLILNYNNSCDYGRILPTGMCDKYSVVDSMYTQTMTSILLDGANTWDAMEEFENTVKFTATGTTVGVEELNMLGAGGLYCDNDLFPNINDDSDVEHCRVDEAGNKFYIYISKDRLMSPDLIGYQIWLQANPFNLIYELAEHLTYSKPYEELDPTQARWEGMDCMRDGAINYHANNSDSITMYPTLEYVAPSINNFEVPMLEPNTDYTIYAEGINTNDTINLGGTDINFNNGTVYTSGDNQWLRIDNNDSFYNMVITKGDTTGEVVPYFEGMTSVENPKLLSNGEGGNLFNGELYVGMLDYLHDTTNTDSTWYHTDYLELEQNTDYCFKMGTNSPRYVFYDENKQYISGIGTGSTKFNTGSAKYTRISAQHRNTETPVQLTLIKGTTPPTEHIPYSESIVSYTDLKLRSLPNGVKDTINVVTGEYVQRVGEITFDGSEDEGWGRYYSIHNLSKTFYYTTSIPSIIQDKVITDTTCLLCNCLKIVSGHSWKDEERLSVSMGKVYVALSRDKVDDINTFKQYLSQNPITVQYELVEPIITKLDPQALLAYTDGTINLSSDTGLLPTTHYTVPSTNTFHLPSMKTGTRYTLKYPSASGSITIGDINYSISSNSMLFTTPLKINGDTSAIIFSDANPENVVLLEGAYNTREVPYFTGVKSVKNPNITITDQLSTESTTYNCETEIELRGLPNGVADKLDIIKGKLTTNVGIRPYQEGDENLPNIWTDGYETVYALSSPVVTNVNIDHPTVTTNSLIELSSDYLIPQLNYRAPSSNNFPLDLLQPNTTYTLYADTLVSGSYTLGGTRTGVYSQPHTITLGDITDNLLTFNGDLGLSNVMLVKGNSLKTTLPPYFLGIRSVTDGHLLVEGMAGEMNEITFDEGIVLRDCNGVKDTIDLITCTLTKRTGEITLTGAEGWSLANTSEVIAHNDYVTFQLILGGVAYSGTSNGALICDTLKHEYQLNMTHEKEGIYSRANAIRICVKKSRIGGDTVDALKSWLNQNPTTVVYTLATPLEVQLENTWTTTPPTSYDNQTEISSTVSSTSLKPMISVTVATTTLEEIVSNLEAQNTQLEEENIATMLALTSIYETMVTPSVATTSVEPEPQATAYSMRRSVRSAEPIGMSVSPMGMVYARLVSKGFKSIDEVPYNLQPEVMYALRGME